MSAQPRGQAPRGFVAIAIASRSRGRRHRRRSDRPAAGAARHRAVGRPCGGGALPSIARSAGLVAPARPDRFAASSPPDRRPWPRHRRLAAAASTVPRRRGSPARGAVPSPLRRLRRCLHAIAASGISRSPVERHADQGGAPRAKHRLSWRGGLFLVGPDPLTSPYYSSGALIVAGVGYATPAFQIGLYLLLFLLAPLYVEAVLLTLSNGGTYVMTRYALSHLGKLAIMAAAAVGIIISFSYVATAIVSLLSYSNYVHALVASTDGPQTLAAIAVSAIPAAAFGAWVMPGQLRRVLWTVAITSLAAVLLSTVLPSGAVVMLAPLVMLFTLNNQGLKESVQVSRSIFLINLVVMGLTILVSCVYLVIHGADFSRFLHGAEIRDAVASAPSSGHVVGLGPVLPGFAAIGAPLLLAGVGTSILGASGVESVMNIPEDLERPRRDVGRIYKWMLSALLAIGGSLSLLIFLVLPPEELATKSHYLLAALGHRAMAGVSGNETLADIWQLAIVANAALMLIGATNTGFAGARGLWQTMARDNLLPRAMLTPNARGAFERIHWMMLAAIVGLALEAEWSLPKLERWYGATFGLVMFSGMVAFILLRQFKGADRRVYTAPLNVTLAGVRVPLAAIVGLLVLGYALLSMYATYRGELGELRTLVTLVMLSVGGVLLLYNHRQLLRAAFGYVRRVIETVESNAIDIEDRTVVVAVGGARNIKLLQHGLALARSQSRATQIPYRQLVAFHVTPLVKREVVYKVTPDSLRPAGIQGSAVRIFTQLTELAQSAAGEITVYLALVPPEAGAGDDHLRVALDALVSFHQRHDFRGHMVLVGSHGLSDDDMGALQARLEGSTLVPIPLFGDA
ncbi:MAG: amino acid permease [Myxococcales bacterium FL481]|nr:MAG: amino acid permease [Myxococcales bacterium FL481]